MKKIVSIFFLLIFHIVSAKNEVKQLEKIINSINKSSDKENLRTIVNYLNYTKEVDFNSFLNIKTINENSMYLEFAKGYFLYLNSDFENASSFFYAIYHKINGTKNFDDQYVFYHYFYDIEKTLGNDTNCLFFLNKINELYLKTENINYLYFFLIEKGVWFRNTKQYNKAIDFLKKAEKISAKVKNKVPFNWLYLHLGRVYLEIGDFINAKYYYDLCKKDIDDSNFNILYILYEYFLVDYYNKDYDNALLKANQMIEIASKNNNIDTYMLVPLYNKIGEIYNNNEPQKAIHFFEKALIEGLKTKQKEGVYEACLQLLKHENITNKARKNIILFLRNVEDGKNKTIITNIKSSERLNNILAFEDNLKEQKSNILLNIIFMISTFIILIVLFIFYFNQKRNLFVIKNQKSELIKQNSVLSKYNAELNLEYGKIEILNNTLAHDVKSGIISIKELAKKIRLNDDNSKIKLASDKIINETEVLNETIDFLLVNAKTDYSSSIEVEEIDWHKILEQVENSLEHLLLLIKPSISLNFDLPYFKGYKTHFYQLFKNLIENSLKYNNPSNNCLISINISKGTNKDLIIEYVDNGLGIEEESLNKIFEFFKQSKFEHISKGYGIGLGICKKIVDSYNGKIHVKSKLNHGTKFTIILKELTD